MRILAWLALSPAVLLFAWGLGLLVSADEDPEGARGMFGWIFLLAGLALIAACAWAIARTRRR
jgi:hypothetical protein